MRSFLAGFCFSAVVLLAAFLLMVEVNVPDAAPAVRCGPDYQGRAVVSASWFCDAVGNRANRLDPRGFYVAHREFPHGALVEVCAEGRRAVVRVLDYGPATWTGRDIDLSRELFAWLFRDTARGHGLVAVRRIEGRL